MSAVFLLSDVLPAGVTERFYAAARDVFDLPEYEKLACLRRGMSGGYTPPGIEGVRGKEPDRRRRFWDTVASEHGGSRYPDSGVGRAYRDAAEALYAACDAAARPFFRARYPDIAPLLDGGRHLLRTSAYEPERAGESLFPTHVDFGLATFYVGGTSLGLQGRIDGDWIDLVAGPGDLLVGLGTTLRLYDPAVAPLRHRVVGTGVARISAVFFTEPRGDVTLPNGVRAADHLHRLVSEIRREPGS